MSGRDRGWVDPYAGMPGRRLFIAVPLSDDAGDAVGGVVEAVRAQGLPAGARDVRWVRLDGLHLTLRFLGPTPDDRVDVLSALVADVAARSPAIEGSIAGAGTFPPSGRPRTLWLGVRDGADALDALSQRLDAALVGAGWPHDDRSFRPHLTLARSDGIAVAPLVAGRLAAAMADQVIPFAIDRLSLFESVTGGGPARYVPVTSAPLAGAP